MQLVAWGASSFFALAREETSQFQNELSHLQWAEVF